MLIAGLSTVVEWYDFTLYLYFSTVLARVFLGTGPQSMTETLGGLPSLTWCGQEDSNFHGLSPTTTSTLRVYQFRHGRTRLDR